MNAAADHRDPLTHRRDLHVVDKDVRLRLAHEAGRREIRPSLKWMVGPVAFFRVFGDRWKRESRANGWVMGCSVTTATGGAKGPQLNILMFDFSSLESESDFLRL